MLNVLLAADFPIAKTGIASTASSILAEDVLGPTCLFSDQALSINGRAARAVPKSTDFNVGLIFTHTEYSRLPGLQLLFPEAIFHVGDWPLQNWKSVRKLHPIKGILGQLRCHLRLARVPRSTRLAFVTHEDWSGAVAKGFSRALHLPIGVMPPLGPLADRLDLQSICFSGNFRYQPNRDAACRLLKLTQTYFPDLRVILIGYYADDFAQQAAPNVEIYANVPSVTEFLADRRPIYVSLIKTGAGAKNKILEAMVAGCPIICTPESLDSSIPMVPSIKIGSREDEIVSQLHHWTLAQDALVLQTACDKLACDTRANRSWRFVAQQTLDQTAAR